MISQMKTNIFYLVTSKYHYHTNQVKASKVKVHNYD